MKNKVKKYNKIEIATDLKLLSKTLSERTGNRLLNKYPELETELYWVLIEKLTNILVDLTLKSAPKKSKVKNNDFLDLYKESSIIFNLINNSEKESIISGGIGL